MNKTALCIVDMQQYYIDKNSSFYQYFNTLQKDSLNYIINRSNKIVIPNIQKLIKKFRNNDSPIYFLKLCGNKKDRSDLHPFFKKANEDGAKNGFLNIYPLCNDSFSNICSELKSKKNDRIFKKTTFSGFTSSDILQKLKLDEITQIVFCGLATSQCVETTARDASDYGFKVIHIEDAQADYDEDIHKISLYSSQGVCGGNIINTENFIKNYL